MDVSSVPILPGALSDPAQAPDALQPADSPVEPPPRRLTLRSLRTHADDSISAGDRIAAPPAYLTSFQYDSRLPVPPVPPPPAPGEVSESVHFRIAVTLSPDDSRTHSVRLLMARLKAVLDGELLTAPERAESTWPRSELAKRSETLQERLTARGCDKGQGGRLETGRPRYPRHGILVAEDGRSEYGFYSMVELAGQLKAPYSAVSSKYLKACRDAGVDPNDHDGIDFTYKGCKIHLKVR